jgi:hypothetical protein
MADTMQLVMTLGATSLIALLNSGSTHNFISEEAARRSGLSLRQRPRLTAMVANGERVTYEGIIRDAPLLIAGAMFPVDLIVMPLAGYDIVVGSKWLGARGPIVWDLACRRMSFQHEGHTVCWQGVAPPTTPRLQATVAVAMDTLLDEPLGAFADIFAEPTGLPPARGHDQRIILKPDASLVAVRPYRYPVAHKERTRAIVHCHDRAVHRSP